MSAHDSQTHAALLASHAALIRSLRNIKTTDLADTVVLHLNLNLGFKQVPIYNIALAGYMQYYIYNKKVLT